MQPRRIGRSDLQIAPLMLGGNVFGWTADETTSFAILDAFVAAGFNGVDTADVYSGWVPGHTGGESETVIGAWLRARGGRERIVLASKVGALAQGGSAGLSANHIIRSVEGSLRRLNTDYIDLYQAHTDDPNTPLEETLEAFERLIGAGKVRAIGGSHYAPARLAEALAASRAKGLPRYDSLQPRYNLCDRAEYEGALQDVCVGGAIGVLAYSSLAKGFLTGKYRSSAAATGNQWEERLNLYGDARGQRILAALDQVAGELGARPGEVALAWLLAQPGVAAAIVAVNSVEELHESLGAPGLSLDQRQADLLTDASAPLAGERR